MKAPLPQQALGTAIKEGRLALGVSQEEFAAQLGMHRTQLGHIEQGRKDCRLSTVIRIAKALHIPASSLLTSAGL
ncbi:helix-turn-helix domain-containing protein [Stenotrophomonas maltophilia]|uniref:helix-turn-helix domain-containing protein n=1 Tax=Stenotrophomonas maltophilia TaxID=40324 RepID=UPI003201CF8C|nr:helix-turn-helix transcriptional regulator [Stenotrophomonas maltophilia]